LLVYLIAKALMLFNAILVVAHRFSKGAYILANLHHWDWQSNTLNMSGNYMDYQIPWYQTKDNLLWTTSWKKSTNC
jgi:hypothetical protein